MAALLELNKAVVRLPEVLAEAMLAGLQEPGVTIGAWAYETELAMCPIAAAVRHAEKSGDANTDWDPAWGTQDDFRHCVLDFVDAFDSCAELVGLESTVTTLRDSLERTSCSRQASSVQSSAQTIQEPGRHPNQVVGESP